MNNLLTPHRAAPGLTPVPRSIDPASGLIDNGSKAPPGPVSPPAIPTVSAVAPWLRGLLVLLAAAAMLFPEPRARAQVVADGATKTLSNVTSSVTGDVVVGTNGSFTLLNVISGALLTNTGAGAIGLNAGARSNTVSVSGTNSRWHMRDEVSVGYFGSFNTLLISNSGRVVNGDGYIGFGNAETNNQVIVSGTNSVWTNNGDVRLGYDTGAVSNRLVILDGGTVFNSNGFVGSLSAGANANSVMVSGTGSLWTNQGHLYAGEYGSSNVLLITNGGRVANSNAWVGWDPGANRNQAIVTGSNSVWANSVSNVVGLRGSFNALLISDGGRVTNTSGSIGATATARSNAVTVTGSGALWTNSSSLYAGDAGSVNTLIISNGGLVVDTSGVIGNSSAARSNQVTVTGLNSVWANSNELRVGNQGSFGTLLIGNGGRVASGSGYLGAASTGSNNQVTVSDPGSLWTNTSVLYVGWAGAANAVVISNGGRVANSGTGYIGFFGVASNNQVTVTGANSLWSNLGDLIVGNLSASNTLLIANGGTLQAANALVGANAGSSNNLLSLAGGALNVTNGSGTAVWEVRRGSAVFNGGSITADNLLLTNSVTNVGSGGAFTFNAGTLNVRNSTVANGTVFTVGSGGGAAALNLVSNGTHTFANHLLIGTNATLTGNGTITGSVTNFGTISPGSSAGALTINGDLRFQPSATAVFEIGGRTATNGYDQLTVSNFVQFAGALDLRLTNNFLPAPGDTFTLVKFASSSGVFNGVWNGLRIPFFGGKASFLVSYETNLTLSAVQYADTDGDGVPDLFEQATGTDPASATSVLRLVPVSVSAGGAVTLRFPYVGGKSYRMQWTDSISSNSWSVITAPVLVETVPGFYDWVDDGTLTGGLATPTRAYRVGLAP